MEISFCNCFEVFVPSEDAYSGDNPLYIGYLQCNGTYTNSNFNTFEQEYNPDGYTFYICVGNGITPTTRYGFTGTDVSVGVFVGVLVGVDVCVAVWVGVWVIVGVTLVVGVGVI